MDVARSGPFYAFAGHLRARCSGCLQRLLLVVVPARVPRSAVAVAQRHAEPAGSRARQRTATGCSPAPHHATDATPASLAPPPRWPTGPGRRPLPAAGVRRRVLARVSDDHGLVAPGRVRVWLATTKQPPGQMPSHTPSPLPLDIQALGMSNPAKEIKSLQSRHTILLFTHSQVCIKTGEFH